ncbi:hypothetical protein V5799_010696 [Amblyomma americanum]|uniref:Uncharacterized protein n=1 Tax=Amblyomma americanum TaxID=6943 RepID=A0AAQ4EJC9_AMBAM
MQDLSDYSPYVRLPAPPLPARRREHQGAPLARPSAWSVDSYERRRRSSQPSQRATVAPAAGSRPVVQPVPVPRLSVQAVAADQVPPDGVVRTAVLNLACPTQGPFPLDGGSQPLALADAFFPSDEEGSQGEWSRAAGNRSPKGLSWWQWLLANLLILLVGMLFVMVVFGSRILSTSGRHGLDRTTPRIVLLPDAGFRNPPPFGLPGPSDRERARDAQRGGNLPPGQKDGATRMGTTRLSRKATTSHKKRTPRSDSSGLTTDD